MQIKMIGVLYPGAMGISVAAAVQRSGQQRPGAPAGRSPATRQRAEGQRLLEISSMKEFCQT
ncbi:MAG: hypothetical protein KAT29_11710, partial [Anaerolineales bacterium]|nr:hypothetical protein [Anaerolineales bacterium]